MNRFCGVGNVCRDIDVRYAGGAESMAIARWSVALNRRFKKEGEQSADFINCIAFGKQAEFVEKYFKKGMKMGFEGRIQSGSYTNKEGVKVYTTDIVVEACEFVESKSQSQSNPSQQQASSNSQGGANGFMNIPDGLDDELPFS